MIQAFRLSRTVRTLIISAALFISSAARGTVKRSCSVASSWVIHDVFFDDLVTIISEDQLREIGIDHLTDHKLDWGRQTSGQPWLLGRRCEANPHV